MESPEKINEQELMEYYGYTGKIGAIKLRYRLLRSWFLQLLASVSPSSSLSVQLHRARGVKIGRHVYIGTGVYLDLLYPQLITIEDYVSIGMNSMFFVHSNATCSKWLKEKYYPRKVAPIKIKKGAWIPPGVIILCGVTIGENSVVGAGSLVIYDIEDYTVVAGSPAKLIKKINSLLI